MIGKILGLGDLASALTIILLYFNIINPSLAGWVIGYLGIKGMIFFGNWNSKIDVVIAIVVLLMTLGFMWKIGVVLSCLWLIQKGIFSMF